MSGAWTEREHEERFARLDPSRQALVRQYAKHAKESNAARTKKRAIGRKLTDVEERIGELMWLDEVVREDKS